MRKYLSLYVAIFRASAIAELEYRVNFVTRIITDIFWYAAQILTFEVLFRHTSLIGDWNLAQTRVFLGVLFVTDAFYMILWHDNLDHISDKVRKGELDIILSKPVNSQFMMSMQRASVALLGNLMLGLGWLIFSLLQLPDFSWWRLLWLLFLIPCGLICLYCCRFMMSTTAVIFTRSENLQFIWYQFYKLGMRPHSIYAPWLRIFLMTFLPVSIIASVPASSLMDPLNFPLFAWAFVLSMTLLWISTKFWKYCLRFYSSASS